MLIPMLILICLLVGAVLGQRFKVLILIPAMGLALTVAGGFAHAGTLWQILGTALIATTSLQMGYLAGVGIRYLMVAIRASRMHGNSLAASTSQRATR